MNLIWHIIKKDISELRWALAFWASCFAYLFFVQSPAERFNEGDLQLFLRFFTVMLLGLFSIGIIATLVQGDAPDDSRGFWRTRPISPLRLVSAKLLLVGALFVALPMLAVVTKEQMRAPTMMLAIKEYGLLAFVLASLTLSFASVAACTRNAAFSLLLWVALIFAVAAAVERLSPALSGKVAGQMNVSRTWAMLGFSSATSLAIILNQYLRRQRTATIWLLIAGTVGTALIGTLWSYYYFYSSQ